MPQLQTERLTLITFTLEMVKTTLKDKAELGKMLAVKVPEDWPGPDYAEALPYIVGQLELDPSEAEWSALIIQTADQTIIGDMGFKGGPDAEGKVEIGYSIIPAYRRHGYAFEAAQAMVAWAFDQPGVKCVTAECLDHNTGSIRVLEKVGMAQVGKHENMLKWEKCSK